MESTDSDKLTFRRQPTVADVQAVHEAIAIQEKAISALDNEIAVLMCNVRRLTHQKSQHLARIRHCRSLITLATRIPSELLATIFEHAASDWARAPIIVSHVCSVWRAAATLPGVWSHIYINCASRDASGRTRFWLSRAQEAPLYITLEVGADISHLEQVMDSLLAHTQQWRSLTVNTLFTHQANYILSRCGQPTPELRRVDIRTDLERRDADEVEDHLVGFREAFNDAPRLSTIHLARELSPTINILPGGITNLFLHLPSWSGPTTISASSIIQLLEGLPLLRHLFLAFPMFHERSFVPPPEESRHASVPFLESLNLILSPNSNGIITYIHAPALRRLQLRSSGEPLGYAHTATGTCLVNFIEQSSPPLKLLELHDIDLPPHDFPRILAGIPELEDLRLHESEIDDTVIHLLNGPVGLCPRLNQFDLRWCGQLTGRALVELVQSRAGHAESAVTEMAVLNCSFVKENDIMDLARITTCRVIMRPHKDVCRLSSQLFFWYTQLTQGRSGSKGCCSNERYRQRLRLRYLINISTEQRPKINLIL